MKRGELATPDGLVPRQKATILSLVSIDLVGVFQGDKWTECT